MKYIDCFYKPDRFSISESEIKDKLETEERFLTSNCWSPLQPRIFQLELSSYCNLRCSICPRSTKHWNRKEVNMSPELVFKMIKRGDLAASRSIELHGFGESLLNPNFSEICNMLKSEGIYLVLSTNGSLLYKDEIYFRLADSPIDYLVFSIDSTIKEVYEKIRVGSDFDKTMGAIGSYLTDMSLTENPPRIILQRVKCSLNKDEDFTTGLYKLFDPLVLQELMDRNKLEIKTVFFDTFSSRVIDSEAESNPSIKPCIDLWYGVFVLADGRVVPCDRDFNGDYSLGDLNYTPLSNIFNSPKMRLFRKFQPSFKGNCDLETSIYSLPEWCLCCKERNLQNMRFIPWLSNDMWNGIKPIQKEE